MSKYCCVLLPLLLTLAAPVAAAEDVQQRGLALIARAAELSELRSPPAGAVLLRARVKLLRIAGWPDGVAEGEYQLVAAASQGWREHLKFPGWIELNGQSGGVRWRLRNTANKPMRMFQALRTVDVGYHLKTTPETKVEKVWEENAGGRKLDCVDATRGEEDKYVLCFDAASGLLARARYHNPEALYEFSGQVALGGKVYPQELHCTEAAEPAVDATIQAFTEAGPADVGELTPQEGAQTWPACTLPTAPRLIEKRDAPMPVHAKATRQFGTVMCLAEVGVDGALHDIAVVQSRGGLLDRSVRDALKGWRYAPATCNGAPVPYEISLKYTFMP